MDQLELSNAIHNGKAFFHEAESFGFSLKHIDMFDQLGAKNFYKLKNEIIKCSLFLPQSRDFTKTDLETNKQAALFFMKQFLGIESLKSLQTVPIEKAAMALFDGATEFCYDATERTITASKIILFRTDLSYSALSLVHENTHILFNHPAPYKNFHIHYNELLPILMEMIAATYLKETLNDPNLEKRYLDLRMTTLKSHFEEYTSGVLLKKAGIQDYIPLEYSIHNSYSYIIATIYALRLFELYQENREEIQKLIQETIQHKKTVEKLLQDTNVSLKNPDTVKATEKVLKMYQK